MLGIVLVLSLGQQYCLSPTGDCDVFAPWRGPRQSRFGWRSPPSGAFFELAPLSGAGMTAACACAAVTGAKGGAVSWTRGSSAYCKCVAPSAEAALATVGIPAGDMTLCSSNLPRVENDGAVLGLLVEDALSGQNIAIQAEDFSNIAWTSTATVTANTTAPPSTNPTSNADTLSDASGAAIQSSCQTISTTSATQFTASVYVTAGTSPRGASVSRAPAQARATASSSTAISGGGAFDRLNCTSPAAYAGTPTAVTVCVEVGTVVGDTGTIIAWGADVKPSSLYLTSYVPTTTVAVTRSADVPTVTLYSALPTTDGSAAASLYARMEYFCRRAFFI